MPTTPYTVVNLAEVKDSAPDFGFQDVQEARFAAGDLDAKRTGLMYLRLRPNRRSAFGHRHEDAEEVYLVLKGRGRIKLDDAIVDVGPLDAIRVAPAVMRAFEAGPDGLEVVAFGAQHPGDGEIVPGWWAP